MNNGIIEGLSAVSSLIAVQLMSGAQIRGEVSEWVSLIGTIAITLTTIGIQIYRLIRDRNTDKNKNQPTEADNEHKENVEKNG